MAREIDGPPLAWFFDGEDRITYVKLAVDAGDIGFEEAAKLLSLVLCEVSASVQLIVFRSRPKTTAFWKNGKTVTDENYPDMPDFEQGKAFWKLWCRLTTYPRIDWNALMRKHPGLEVSS